MSRRTSLLVLGADDVEALLDLDALVDALASAMADLSAGRASLPPRNAALVAERDGLLAAMPAYLPSAGVLTTKLVSVFPRNTDRPSHQGVIVAFDPANGTPIALLDATTITALRTAAGSALATKLLARTDARVLAVLGTGVQARAHLHAITRIRRFADVRVAGRDPERTRAFAAEMSGALGREVRPMRSWHEATADADVVCGATHPHEPVIRRAWIRPGTHVNSVGFDLKGREVDAETIRDSLLVVESRAAALAPAPAGSNDLIAAIREGLVTAAHVHAEIGELVNGTRPGRTSREQITLYKSVGVAVQDAAAADLVLRRAAERGVGRMVDL